MKNAPSREAAENIDEYIGDFPDEIRKILKKIRATIRKAAPKAVESISYRIPTYKVDGKVLIYFAGFANHVSVYPAPREAKEFAIELSEYKGGKGTVQFPTDKPIPYELVTRIVKFKLEGLDKSRQERASK